MKTLKERNDQPVAKSKSATKGKRAARPSINLLPTWGALLPVLPTVRSGSLGRFTESLIQQGFTLMRPVD